MIARTRSHPTPPHVSPLTKSGTPSPSPLPPALLLRVHHLPTPRWAVSHRWCGLLLNTATLEVQSDYSRYSGTHVRSHIAVPFTSQPGGLAGGPKPEGAWTLVCDSQHAICCWFHGKSSVPAGWADRNQRCLLDGALQHPEAPCSKQLCNICASAFCSDDGRCGCPVKYALSLKAAVSVSTHWKVERSKSNMRDL